MVWLLRTGTLSRFVEEWKHERSGRGAQLIVNDPGSNCEGSQLSNHSLETSRWRVCTLEDTPLRNLRSGGGAMEAGRGLITNRGRRGNEQHWRARDMKRCPEGKGLRRSASRPNGREDEDDDEVEGKEEVHKSRKPNDGNRKIATEPRPRRPTRTEPPLSPPARAAERPLFFFLQADFTARRAWVFIIQTLVVCSSLLTRKRWLFRTC